MPFKNREVRRRYERERRRRLKELANPDKPVRKCYISLGHADIYVARGAYFRNGLLVTTDPLVQIRVEAMEEYGRSIFSWRVEP